MSVIVTCPACQRQLQVPEDFFGKNVQCPECKGTFLAEPVASSAAMTTSAAPGAAPSGAASATEEYEAEAPPRRRAWDDEDRDDVERRRRRRALQPHRGGTILAFGIVALLTGALGLVFGPLAWVMGNTDLRLMRAGQMDPSGESQTNTGRILGMVATFLHIIGILVACVIGGLFIFLGIFAGHPHRRR
jgi:hypothetical protein